MRISCYRKQHIECLARNISPWADAKYRALRVHIEFYNDYFSRFAPDQCSMRPRPSTKGGRPSSPFPPGPSSAAIKQLHEEFKRRIKTQTVLPLADTAAMMF